VPDIIRLVERIILRRASDAVIRSAARSPLDVPTICGEICSESRYNFLKL
jgi:hypothetical protein